MKLFATNGSDMRITELDDKAWVIQQLDECIFLGVYPNKRFELLEKALRYAKEKTK